MSASSDKRLKKARSKKFDSFDLLDITESLGYQTHRKAGRNSWNKEDDQQLIDLVNSALIEMNYTNGLSDIKSIQESIEISKKISWENLASKFENSLRTGKDLRKRWTGSLDPNLKKGRWTKEEDELLVKAYEKHGSHWLSVSMEIAGRTEDQCAKRYIEVLGPTSKGRLREWTVEEDLALISKVKKYGTKWRKISSEMTFRPSLTCRNRWRKIITLVVRNRASEEITKAVKENKNIDLTKMNPIPSSKSASALSDFTDNGAASGTTSNNSLVLNSFDTPQLIGTSSSHPSLAGFNDPLRRNKLIQSNVSNSRSASPSFEIAETSQQKSAEQRQKNFASPLSSLENTGRPKQDSVSVDTETEWKFILKDGKGLSISNGRISNSELVTELLEQAKKYSLKISVHQHIHNHYGPHINANSNISRSMSTENVRTSVASASSIASSTTNGQNTPNSMANNMKNEFTAPFERTDFVAKNQYGHVQNSTKFSFSPNTQVPNSTGSTPNLFYPNLSNNADNNIPINISQSAIDASASASTGTTNSFNTLLHAVGNGGTELPKEIEPNRLSHFNYLPPTIKPQLESSDISKSAHLSRILNPSPNNHIQSPLSGVSSNVSTSGSKSSLRKRKKRKKNKESQHSSYKIEEEQDGVDFWETLSKLSYKHQKPADGGDNNTEDSSNTILPLNPS
ncbi:hypothetical protein KAFR_0H00130 [Kazachstania africana CBS 2517]|uniref:Uncharacterized protein n=1 Tax=Kazachstania africana (strain ATCC 22294 / BCRC 22015 / CBS 2517 / CECT 1963 / NBRC 1671 / NRRL Y-8276) TaxID=1071382 RepID=H2AYL7_KAZAF|nr:hypothetical protein KAFR_0H00130 [Kazachstania africana CBS 2517]CCF59423.1 hypothetical protein KAFR_0H00130 [Kazachstania africana CBS 2517]